MPQVCPKPDIWTTNFREDIARFRDEVLGPAESRSRTGERQASCVASDDLMLTDDRKLPAGDPCRSKANIGTYRNPVCFGIVI
jgi:hypothetical protein